VHLDFDVSEEIVDDDYYCPAQRIDTADGHLTNFDAVFAAAVYDPY